MAAYSPKLRELQEAVIASPERVVERAQIFARVESASPYSTARAPAHAGRGQRAIAVVSSLIVFTDDWAVGGGIIGGAAVVLIGLRIAIGKKLGGEVVVWGSLLTALAAIVVAIILDSS